MPWTRTWTLSSRRCICRCRAQCNRLLPFRKPGWETCKLECIENEVAWLTPSHLRSRRSRGLWTHVTARRHGNVKSAASVVLECNYSGVAERIEMWTACGWPHNQSTRRCEPNQTSRGPKRTEGSGETGMRAKCIASGASSGYCASIVDVRRGSPSFRKPSFGGPSSYAMTWISFVHRQ